MSISSKDNFFTTGSTTGAAVAATLTSSGVLILHTVGLVLSDSGASEDFVISLDNGDTNIGNLTILTANTSSETSITWERINWPIPDSWVVNFDLVNTNALDWELFCAYRRGV